MNQPIVAAVQFAPVLHDVFKNVKTAQQMAFEACAKGASVVVLPELCLSGYVLESKREAADCAQTKNGYQTESLAKIAQKFNAHVVFGYVEAADGNLYNSAAVVGPSGLEANVRKHNLWGPDFRWASMDESLHPVVVTRAGRLGTLICRDVMNNYRDTYKFYNPSHRFYKKGSVDTVALLTNWGADFGFPDASWMELSEETGSNIIVSNRIGEERDLKFKGGSVVIDRKGNLYTYGSSYTDMCVVGGTVML